MPRFSVPMLLVFALTLFTSATLLFLVEPMIGKMILPFLGGTPAVWNTCMVFFQAVLLLGYLYAHLSTSWLGARKQAVLHLFVLAVPFLFLPLVVNRDLIKGDENPVLLVLMLLALTVGVPMFVVSASAPLLQKWFASTSHPSAHDPYFLYGASNLGSMLALIAYPAVVEPYLRIPQQSADWRFGYGILAALTILCAVFLWMSPRPVEKIEKTTDEPNREANEDTLGGAVTALRVLRWVALAFVPSSLMLGTTTYITTDIAAIPLLWVAPLALYLFTFILVFSHVPAWLHKGMVLLMPLLVLTVFFFMLSELTTANHWIEWRLGMHLAALFVVSMVCHGELARDRPAPMHLTGYFLWMSVGGVLGGLFNGLLAPLIFKGIVEYEIVMMLACFLAPPLAVAEDSSWGRRADGVMAALFAAVGLLLVYMRLSDAKLKLDFESFKNAPWLWQSAALLLGVLVGVVAAVRHRDNLFDRCMDLVLPLCLGLLLLGLAWGLPAHVVEKRVAKIAELIHVHSQRFFLILTYGVPIVLCYTFVERSLRFALGVGAILLIGTFTRNLAADILHQERSFFGVLWIQQGVDKTFDVDLTYRSLYHGTTLHGIQLRNEERREEPLTYYHRSGPIGEVMLAYNQPNPHSGRLPNLAVIGLGTGTMACYAQPGQQLTFYDIDPVVRRFSYDEDNPYFSFVADARRRGAQLDLVMGDARLTMEKKKLKDSEKYDIMVLDAFSSDAIPIHLLTKEALQIYLDKLSENGLLCFHISNRHLDLRPVLYNLARECGLSAVYQDDDYQGDGEGNAYLSSAYFGKSISKWVVLARNNADLDALRHLNDWESSRRAARGGLLPLMLCPDNGSGLASQSMLLFNLLGEEVCKRPSPWQELQPDASWPNPDKVGVWTDDYSNLLSVFWW